MALLSIMPWKKLLLRSVMGDLSKCYGHFLVMGSLFFNFYYKAQIVSQNRSTTVKQTMELMATVEIQIEIQIEIQTNFGQE